MTATCSFSARRLVFNSVQCTQFSMGVLGAILHTVYLEEPIRLPSPHRINLEEPVRVASPTRINLEEPVRVASPTRINLEEPVRVVSPTRINSFLCLSFRHSVCKG